MDFNSFASVSLFLRLDFNSNLSASHISETLNFTSYVCLSHSEIRDFSSYVCLSYFLNTGFQFLRLSLILPQHWISVPTFVSHIPKYGISVPAFVSHTSETPDFSSYVCFSYSEIRDFSSYVCLSYFLNTGFQFLRLFLILPKH